MNCLRNRRQSLVVAVLLVLSVTLAAGCFKGKEKNDALVGDTEPETLTMTHDELIDLLGIEESDLFYGKVRVDLDEPHEIKVVVEMKPPGNVGVGVSTTRAEIAEGTILASALQFSKLGSDMPDKMRVCISIAEIDEAGDVQNRSSSVYTQQDIFGPETTLSYWTGPDNQAIEEPGSYEVLRIMTAAGLESGKRILSGDPDYVPAIDEGMLRVTAIVGNEDLQ
jgi:hypothetical protein